MYIKGLLLMYLWIRVVKDIAFFQKQTKGKSERVPYHYVYPSKIILNGIKHNEAYKTHSIYVIQSVFRGHIMELLSVNQTIVVEVKQVSLGGCFCPQYTANFPESLKCNTL